MNLVVKRNVFTDTSTIGELWVNGTFFCYTLEDKDRGLIQTQPITEIAQKKLFGKTAIPLGKYDLALTFSNRFQKYMPQVLNVPCFDGIRIHSGNNSEQTDGCLLVGMKKGENVILESKTAFNTLMSMLKTNEKKMKMTIEYVADNRPD